MKEYILESLEDGSHGIIPDEGINYFVGHNRITIHKDGKKVLDKVVDVNPDGSIVKYNLCCDDDKDPTLEPIKAKEVDEYNIGNMLPQVVPSGTPLKKQELCNESNKDEIDGEVLTEGALEVILGGAVVITGTLIAAKIINDITMRKAVDWYAEHNNVSPKFSELKKKNFKVKFDKKTSESKLTNKEKLLNLDNNNVAEVYYYNDKRTFAVVYGSKNTTKPIFTVSNSSSDTSTGFIVDKNITVNVICFDDKFKQHIEYYAAKSMFKHKYSMASIDNWVTGITSEYKKFKKEQKDVKESYDLDVLDERLDNLLEECSDIIDGIMSNTSESADDSSEDLVITENANDDLIEEGAKESIEKAVKISKSEIDKLCNLAKEKLELFKTLKDEKDNLIKKDIKKKIINNQKKFRDLIKGFPLKNRKAVTKVYGGVNLNTINQINQMEFQRQMEEAIRQHQQFMDTVNQNNMMHQQMMMNNMMF